MSTTASWSRDSSAPGSEDQKLNTTIVGQGTSPSQLSWPVGVCPQPPDLLPLMYLTADITHTLSLFTTDYFVLRHEVLGYIESEFIFERRVGG